MEGGFGILGLFLFLFSISNFYTRSDYWLAVLLFALSLVSLGMAFSERPNRRTWALGIGVAMMVLALTGVVLEVAWWKTLLGFLFGLSYLILWAEYRFPFFENVRPDEVPPPRRLRHR